MPKLPSITSQDVIKILKKKGFILDRVKEVIIFTIIQKQKEEL